MRIVAALAMLAVSAGSATASGGLSCDADGDSTMSLEGGVSRGMGGALFNFAGKLEIKSPGVGEDLRVTEFSREDVAQYWLDGEALKLRLYREREDGPHGYVEVVVETALGDEGSGEGEYLVTVYDMTNAVNSETEPARFTGPISCSVE
ncbi:hypothetical protein [Neoaquamicrobium sediminum]|uniref:hypothetical protein n=1 Tax=Neoaquamicrobium sediminum TaxID=1849104 RepID=UPI003BABED9D